MIFAKQPILLKNSVRVVVAILIGAGLFALGYWEGRRALRQEMNALAAEELHAEQGNHFAPPGPGQATPPMSQAGSAVDASLMMKEFLQNRALLAKNFADLHSQMTKANPPASTQDIDQHFREQNKALLERQSQLAQLMAQQRAKTPLPGLPPLQIPPNASPALKAYLAARDKIIRDQLAFMNQHRGDDPATRQTAMQQWRQQNATRFDQLRQMAQALTPIAHK